MSTTSKAKRQPIAAWIATGTYLAVVAIYVVQKWDAFPGLQPNAFGDFLAGVFSPLAFAWLVYGYLLQRDELAAQRDQLELQRQEMIDTRQELARQASAIEASNSIANKDYASRTLPSFLLTSSKQGKNYVILRLENKGGTALDVFAGNHSGGWSVPDNAYNLGTFESGQGKEIHFNMKGAEAAYPLCVAIEFTTPVDDSKRAASWEITASGSVTRNEWHKVAPAPKAG